MPTYLITMQMRSILGTMALVVPLLAILVAAGWFAASAWVSVEGPPMPATGYLAMALGVVFSLIVGCGLMAFCSIQAVTATTTRSRPTTTANEAGSLPQQQFCDGHQLGFSFSRLPIPR